MEKYLQSCKSEFWKKVFKAELDYILHQLKGTKDVLSVGCGPAIIEQAWLNTVLTLQAWIFPKRL